MEPAVSGGAATDHMRSPQATIQQVTGQSTKITHDRNASHDGHGHEEPLNGDGKVPAGVGGPGRKSKACQECKRLKMKCEVLPGSRTCNRCIKRKLQCIQTRVSWGSTGHAALNGQYERKIDAMQDQIQQLQQTLNTLVQQGLRTTPLQSVASPVSVRSEPVVVLASPLTTSSNISDSLHSARSVDNTRMDMTRENSPEPMETSDNHKLVSVIEPMGSLYEVTRLRNIRSDQSKTFRSEAEEESHIDDFISRGLMSEGEAQELYKMFHATLNHYLWVGLEEIHRDLNSIRRSSQLLTATILTVAALHVPTSTETFDRCYKEFLSLISSSMFSRYHSIDDVRGLCIAAFWLPDVSWKLSGHAIRIATELNIHHSFYKALEGDGEHFLRARLWYMLYVCDHHFSVAYGRPPMISESVQIREHDLFLRLPQANALDERILSQVALMQILTRVQDVFAERRLPQHDTSQALLSEADFPLMRNFNLEIDQWRIKWHARQRDNPFIGTFPPKGIILYSYFAKLQLNAYAIRGISVRHGRLSTERKEFANMAISAAASVLTFVLEEDDLRRALVGTPLYVHTMIAFASVFLMKVTTKWNRILGLNVEQAFVWGLLERMIHLLKSSVTSARHLLYHIAAGLEQMLKQHDMSQQPSGDTSRSSSNPVRPDGENMTMRPAEYQLGENAGIGTWDPFGTPSMLATDFNLMNGDLIWESFDSDSVHDVYNLLSSQFTQ